MAAQQVLDIFPHFNYARVVHTQSQQIPQSAVANLFAEVDAIVPAIIKPSFVLFAGKIMIAGGTYDVIWGSAYYLTHPDEQYVVDIYDAEDEALSRFEAVWGYDYFAHGDHQVVERREVREELTPADIYFTSDAVQSIFDYCADYEKSFSTKGLLPDSSPIYLGHTGASKSSFVKAAVSKLNKSGVGKYGFRLVDIRAPFLDKNDLLGFVAEQTNEQGISVFTDSPNMKLLTCTTQFVQQCRKIIERDADDMNRMGERWGKEEVLSKAYHILNEAGVARLYDDEVPLERPIPIENMPDEKLDSEINRVDAELQKPEVDSRIASQELASIRAEMAQMRAELAASKAQQAKTHPEEPLRTATDTDKAKLYKKLKYYAQTPIMWFDEINRAPMFIYNQIMGMINRSALENYQLDICPKMAAGNAAIECADVDADKLKLINYFTQNIADGAAVDRFKPVYYISSKDTSVLLSSAEWLIENYPAKLCVALVEWAHNNDWLYSVKSIDSNGKFPTFRGWEDTCKYLSYWEKTLKGKEKLHLNIFASLLGDNILDPIKPEIEKLIGADQIDYSQSDTVLLSHTMGAGIPTLLLGKMAIGKTAILKEAGENINCDVVDISGKQLSQQTATDDQGVAVGFKGGVFVESVDLCTQDPTTVGGSPTPGPFFATLMSLPLPRDGRDNDDIVDYQQERENTTSDFFKDIEREFITNPGVPKQTTRFLPSASIQARIDEIRSLAKRGIKKKLILNFDELNRCQPVVQSAIFEAISEKRFRGCDLTGIDVSVVATGNYQTEKEIGEVGRLYNVFPVDSANLMRFATVYMTEYTPDRFRKFMKWAKINLPLAYDMMSNMTEDEALALLNTPIEANKQITAGQTPDGPNGEFVSKIWGAGDFSNPKVRAFTQSGGGLTLDFDTRSFTSRTLSHLQRVLNQNDIDLLPNDVADISNADLLKLLQSPTYIFNTSAHSGSKNLSTLTDYKKLFPAPKNDISKISFKQIVQRLVELLQDNGSDVEISLLKVLLEEIENLYWGNRVDTQINNIQVGIRDKVGDLLTATMARRTATRVSMTGTDIFSLDPDERAEAEAKLIGSSNPNSSTYKAAIVDGLVGQIVQHDTIVALWLLDAVVNELNASPIAQATSHVTVQEVLAALAARGIDRVDMRQKTPPQTLVAAKPVTKAIVPKIVPQDAAPTPVAPPPPPAFTGVFLEIDGGDLVAPKDANTLAQVEELSKYVDIISTRDLAVVPLYSKYTVAHKAFYVGCSGIHTSLTKGAMVVPDMFGVNCRLTIEGSVGAVFIGDDVVASLFFDPEIWRWEVVDQENDVYMPFLTSAGGGAHKGTVKVDTFTLIYYTKETNSYGYDVKVTFNKVRNQMFRHIGGDLSAEPDQQKPSAAKVINEEEWNDMQGKLPQCSTRLLAAAHMTMKLYDASLNNLPDMDVVDAEKLKNLADSPTAVGDQQITHPTVSMYAPFFRKTWRYVEVLFT